MSTRKKDEDSLSLPLSLSIYIYIEREREREREREPRRAAARDHQEEGVNEDVEPLRHGEDARVRLQPEGHLRARARRLASACALCAAALQQRGGPCRAVQAEVSRATRRVLDERYGSRVVFC